MAFSGDGTKLTGSQGTIYKFTLGAEIAGDASTPLPVGYYVVTAVAGTSAFPAPASGGAEIRVKDILQVKTGDTITPAIGDDVKPITLVELCDVSAWTATLSADEIETTTFCDVVKTYARGKVDLQGQLNGIVTVGTTTDEGGFLNRFLDIAKQDGDTSYDVFTADPSALLAYLVSSEGGSGVDEIGLWAPIEVFGAGIGGDQASAQTFDSSFRIDSGGDVNLLLTRFAVA